ncbi:MULTISPECIES: hypothetical protein [Clostridium]|uniref:hypothetical protein n=1 Tax=Clostridium TaxID=1485 RepID=UPI000774D4D3|nr:MULTISPECIES: hypothetical protein [Clostridium]AUM96141.1 hypothetical protein RSJ11_13670 [Clostridium sporogenes]AVQ53592.1 hypothetical protein C7M59_12285 [Clostridium botulinum]
MIYLSINDNSFYFKDSEVSKIEENDILVEKEIHDRFIEETEKAKKFKVINPKGSKFYEIFEEIEQETINLGEIEPSPIEKLQQENKELQKQLDKQNARLDEQNKAMAEMMNLIAIQGVAP